MYASEGSNVTICWKIVPKANPTLLSRFTVVALLRPGEKQTKTVGQAYSNGTHDRTFPHHAKLYIGRATVEADLVSKILYLRLVNYTSEMENIYCAHYEMGSGSNPITTCHSQAVFLRNTGKHMCFHHCTKSSLHQIYSGKIWSKKVQTRGESKAKMVNTTFAY